VELLPWTLTNETTVKAPIPEEIVRFSAICIILDISSLSLK